MILILLLILRICRTFYISERKGFGIFDVLFISFYNSTDLLGNKKQPSNKLSNSRIFVQLPHYLSFT